MKLKKTREVNEPNNLEYGIQEFCNKLHTATRARKIPSSVPVWRLERRQQQRHTSPDSVTPRQRCESGERDPRGHSAIAERRPRKQKIFIVERHDYLPISV